MKLGVHAPNYTMMEHDLLDCAPPEIVAKAMLLGVKIKMMKNWTHPPFDDNWYVCKDCMILGVDGGKGDYDTDPKSYKTPEEALAAAVNPHKDGLVWL